MTHADVVLVETASGVRTLTLNRPDRLNAANDELLYALTDALEAAGADTDVRVVVITGAGRGFCAGQDLGGVSGRNMSFTEHLNATYNPLIRTIRMLDKPVITAVNGVAAGAGASLALAGDIRLWAQSARLIEVFSTIALIPDSGSTWFLPRLVGYHRAFELMALAEPVLAEEGLRAGLCERVYPDETFLADVQAYAERLAARPANALALTKRALNFALTSTLDAALDQEAALQQLAGDHPEHAEGVAAFKEKRAPDFRRPR
ncbi:2-(1,2-epoxy-1,2-dihydrophenyl)acetyl-CoA isomerase [Deinococcus metalli]|uniref:2-(1,2-epoxy-1,2-dihydrophenyl)acetyl-CoA isomerase n=1 Tax=Deinococcus metalli TaxID=1141878 RepID=A0A7W8NPE5_9DEIO|nr:enoyl-CoA hydratase-related protein [Deinococcus metalli]MBB5374748.1 2-(1,2-epoxy-1,2-dihydrophenyl)acetyl-CoA isomerase [Deinococcus metalli]GHF33998.1 enoyl-CoA hydratase [Deinococcus metalli]